MNQATIAPIQVAFERIAIEDAGGNVESLFRTIRTGGIVEAFAGLPGVDLVSVAVAAPQGGTITFQEIWIPLLRQ